MIDFRCPGCRRHFKLKDHFAGKKAKCNKCGGPIEIPLARVETVAEVIEPRVPVRTRRLLADAKQINEIFGDWPAIHVQSITGDPPECYQFEYSVRGIEKLSGERPVFRDTHLVEVTLPMDFPRLSPKCRMLTPIFHPNIDSASICVGDHWTAGERLADLVIRIGEMITYQAYNIKSPLNGEAAMWADLNPNQLPIDSRVLRPAEVEHV